MRGISVRRRHFGFAKVALCAWADCKTTAGNTIPSINYPKISKHLAFQHHLLALYFWGEPTLAVPNVIFLCLAISRYA